MQHSLCVHEFLKECHYIHLESALYIHVYALENELFMYTLAHRLLK